MFSTKKVTPFSAPLLSTRKENIYLCVSLQLPPEIRCCGITRPTLYFPFVNGPFIQ